MVQVRKTFITYSSKIFHSTKSKNDLIIDSAYPNN